MVRPTNKKTSLREFLKRLSSHAKLTRSNILAAFLAVLVFGVLLTLTAVGDTLFFYCRVAHLYFETPEARISMPLVEVSKNQIANTWHAPRGTDRVHEGQDIFAPKGTPIYSATKGYVYKIGENNLGGQTVSVIGAGGRVYYYAHLDSYARALSEGDYVTPKTILGYVGTTGNAQGTPPHLHFGIYTSSGAINPLPLLADRVPANASGTRPPTQKTPRSLVSRKV
jgi:murein DD-endopeptidase MepM/ murein hydrolase activator NlpD